MSLAEQLDLADYVNASTAATFLEELLPGAERNWYEFLEKNRVGQTSEETIPFSRHGSVVYYLVSDLHNYFIFAPLEFDQPNDLHAPLLH